MGLQRDRRQDQADSLTAWPAAQRRQADDDDGNVTTLRPASSHQPARTPASSQRSQALRWCRTTTAQNRDLGMTMFSTIDMRVAANSTRR